MYSKKTLENDYLLISNEITLLEEQLSNLKNKRMSIKRQIALINQNTREKVANKKRIDLATKKELQREETIKKFYHLIDIKKLEVSITKLKLKEIKIPTIDFFINGLIKSNITPKEIEALLLYLCQDKTVKEVSLEMNISISRSQQLINRLWGLFKNPRFLKEWFADNDHKYYGSYFSHKDIDVFALVKHLKLLYMLDTPNDKLETLCKHFGIEIDAHNALSDIEATRSLYKALVSNFFKDNSEI